MLSDFEMIVRHFPKREDITIIPISDVHLGAKECNIDAWEKFCADIAKKNNAYIVLGGDLINNATRSSVSNIFDEVMRPSDQKRVMAKMLEPLRDKIICAVTGNHERRSGKDADDDPTYDILCKLDIENIYRENIAFAKIQIGNIHGDGNANPTYSLAITHGSGGGIYTGGAVNRNERFGYILDGVDCLIVGHTHKPFVTQPSKLFVDTRHNKISIKPFKVVSSTSWLNYGGYAVQKMLLPSSHALQIITLCHNHKEIKVAM